jgi:hypothetical protein
VRSSPDVLGLISWNEFSENSYIEPSQKFGTRYLDVMRELRATPVPQPPSATDSNKAVGASTSAMWRDWQGVLLLGFPVLLAVVVALLANQRRRRAATHPGPMTVVSPWEANPRAQGRPTSPTEADVRAGAWERSEPLRAAQHEEDP